MSHLATRIAHSTAYQTLGKAVSVILGLVQVALLTRYFQEAGFGQYATVNAYLGFALVLAELGLYIITVKEISRPDGEPGKILSNAFTLRLVSSAIIIPLAAIIAWFFFPYDAVVKMGIVVATSAFVFLSVNQVFVGVFQKHLANHTLVIGEMAGKAIGIAAILAAAQLNLGIVAILAALNISFIVNVAITMYFAHRYVPFSLAFDLRVWKSLLSQSWPIAFSVVLNLIYFKIDTVILSVLKSPADVGVYSLPYKILEVSLAFPGMFVGLLMPLLSAAAATSDFESFKKVLQNGFNFLVYATLLMIVSVLIFAENIIDLIASSGFSESAGVFRLLIFAAAFLFIGTLFAHAVPTLNLQKKMIWGYLLGALAGLALYFILIPKFSYYGAAIGTLITEFIVAVFAAVLVLKRTSITLNLAGTWRAIAAALAILVLGLLTKNQPWLPWYLALPGLVLVYVGLLLAFGALRRDEIKLLLGRKLEI